MNTTTKALNWRYATKVFDPAKKVSDADIAAILESGRLAPSSFGIEAWAFVVVADPKLRAALRAAAYGQPKVTDASHLVVIARRTDARTAITNELIERTSKITGQPAGAFDSLKGMVDGSMKSRSDAELDAWVKCQCYIPLGTMIEAASLLNIDNCPMEGFDPKKVDEILGLPAKNLVSTTMLALGYRGADPAAGTPKVRRPTEEVVIRM